MIVIDLLGDPVAIALRIAGLGLLALATAFAVGLGYRWYARDQVPEGLAVLLGVGAVAVWLNTRVALAQFLGDPSQPLAVSTAVIDVAAFAVAAFAAAAGGRLGDRAAVRSTKVAGSARLNGDLSPIVRAVGRIITVELPDEIEDIEGYDPVTEETKAALAGETLLFPRGLRVDDVEKRLIERLKADHAVAHVDVDVELDGTVTYLGLGASAAGLGPTLAPGTVAVAIRADPAYSASPGDLVQVWRGGESPKRVATGELRGTAGDVVTVALDEPDAKKLDDRTTYRLQTLAIDSRPDREFAAMLRSADETMSVIAVEEGSSLEKRTVGSLDASIVAVRPAAGDPQPLPPRDRVIEPGDALYVVARPETLRRIESAATAVSVDVEESATGGKAPTGMASEQ